MPFGFGFYHHAPGQLGTTQVGDSTGQSRGILAAEIVFGIEWFGPEPSAFGTEKALHQALLKAGGCLLLTGHLQQAWVGQHASHLIHCAPQSHRSIVQVTARNQQDQSDKQQAHSTNYWCRARNPAP